MLDMSNRLNQFLQRHRWLLADGAMGTNLLARGLPPGTAPERWNLDAPEHIKALHLSFLQAGADIILTNSFGGNRRRLTLLGEHDFLAINRTAAELAREAVDNCGRQAIVAGSMGPSGALLVPYGDLTWDEARALFAEQAAALASGGVDCLWIETMAAGDEMSAAVSGALETGLPLVCTFSFDSHGHTMMGLSPEDALGIIETLPQQPLAFGANCGCGTLDTVSVIAAMRKRLGPDVPLVAKANCGQPEYRDGAFQYGKSVEHMSSYAQLARDAGARIIGGCCGTTAKHLRAMRDALENYCPQPYDQKQASALLSN